MRYFSLILRYFLACGYVHTVIKRKPLGVSKKDKNKSFYWLRRRKGDTSHHIHITPIPCHVIENSLREDTETKNIAFLASLLVPWMVNADKPLPRWGESRWFITCVTIILGFPNTVMACQASWQAKHGPAVKLKKRCCVL